VADLDTRLAEFDRKLREIQSDLAPDRAVPPARAAAAIAEPPPAHEPPPAPAEPEPQAQPERRAEHPQDPRAAEPYPRGRSGPLADLLQHTPPPRREPPAQGLDELGGLLVSLHQVLEGLDSLLTRMAAQPREATIAAGPFRTMDEVHDFERELSAVPGVRGVTIRGYEGAAKAIIDVHFGGDH
jgi:hypothetical protein